jgi:hypothetical protein
MNNLKIITIIVLTFVMFGCESHGENKKLAALEAQVKQLEAQVRHLEEEIAYQSFIIGPGADFKLSSFENFLKAADFWQNVTVPSNGCSKKCSKASSKAISICKSNHPVDDDRKECVDDAVKIASSCQRSCPKPVIR